VLKRDKQRQYISCTKMGMVSLILPLTHDWIGAGSLHELSFRNKSQEPSGFSFLIRSLEAHTNLRTVPDVDVRTPKKETPVSATTFLTLFIF
jgi:hypothetical protein